MSEIDLERCLVGRNRVAKALNRDNHTLAAIIAVQLRLPAINAVGMAKLAAAKDLHKYNPDEPRVPAGDPGGGEWTAAGAVVGEAAAQQGTLGSISW